MQHTEVQTLHFISIMCFIYWQSSWKLYDIQELNKKKYSDHTLMNLYVLTSKGCLNMWQYMTIPSPCLPKTWYHMQSKLHADFGETDGTQWQQNEDAPKH